MTSDEPVHPDTVDLRGPRRASALGLVSGPEVSVFGMVKQLAMGSNLRLGNPGRGCSDPVLRHVSVCGEHGAESAGGSAEVAASGFASISVAPLRRKRKGWTDGQLGCTISAGGGVLTCRGRWFKSTIASRGVGASGSAFLFNSP